MSDAPSKDTPKDPAVSAKRRINNAAFEAAHRGVSLADAVDEVINAYQVAEDAKEISNVD